MSPKFKYLPFILICVYGKALSQNYEEKLDSLKRVVAVSETNDAKGETALEIIRLYNRTHVDSTALYLGKAKRWLEKTKNTKLKARLYLFEANHLQNTGRFEASIEANQKAINLYDSINDIQGLASAYNSLGLSYKKNSGDNNEVEAFSIKGLEYEKKALEYYLQSKDYDGLLRVYSNIGIIHRDLKQFKEAEEAYLKGIALAKEKNYDGYSLGILKANLSQIYLDYYKKHERAIELLNEAIVNYKKNGVRTSMEHAYRNISYNYTELKEYDKAIFFANKAVEIANEVKDPHRQVNAYSSLHHAQKMAGLYKESLENLELLNDIEDSLYSMEKTTMVAEMDARFQAVKKDAEIQVLTKENELKKWRIWVLLFGIIALAGLIYSLMLKRRKDKLLFEKEKALEIEKREKAEIELEAKRKELTAKVLQLAHKNEFLSSLDGEIANLKNNVDSSVNKTTNRISRMIKRDIDGDKQWKQFSEEFSSLHQGFITALSKKHGSFSKSEIRLISLLKMNLSSKEIADVLGISSDGVKKARYRLRKKMNIEESELQSYILSFN